MCPKRIALRKIYDRTAAAYARSVQDLNRRIGICSRDEYEILRLDSETARTDAEAARIALQTHVAEHQCDAALRTRTAGGSDIP
jgi:hypothetical protein